MVLTKSSVMLHSTVDVADCVFFFRDTEWITVVDGASFVPNLRMEFQLHFQLVAIADHCHVVAVSCTVNSKCNCRVSLKHL